jgi:hypothetical protein
MLITNIYSILQSNPESHISVFWQDVDEHIIKAVMKTFGTATFYKTNFDFDSDPIRRISSKTHLWNYAAQKYQHDYLCFLDVDTLVIKRIQHFFDKDFDIAFTYKDEQFSLNTGVMLCKGNKYPHFFKLWENETLKIINNPELFEKANSPEYPYGASDQMSLFEMLQYKSDQRDYIFAIDGQNILFKGIPCEVLNETNSREIADTTHIIHYKGGWQPILLEGHNFTKHRSKKLSWGMYIQYLKTFKKSLEYLQAATKTHFKPQDLSIIIPFYISTSTLRENKFLYSVYSYYDQVRNRFK